MAAKDQREQEVDRFILENIDSVPHLEALLLLWNSRPATWGAEDLATRLYVRVDVAQSLLRDLAREDLIAAAPNSSERFLYESQSPERDQLIRSVDEIYREQLVRVSRMIHSKAPTAVRDFARAFRLTKERG